MQDIAHRAGVSRASVSYALNGRREGVFVSEATRERVLEAARELGYRRNDLARAVVTGRNPMLGFLAALPEAEATSRMMAGALDEADAHGYTLKVLRLSGATLEQGLIERCVELRLAGVLAIYVEAGSLERLHDELARHHIPLAVLEREAHTRWGVGAITDDDGAMGLAIEHLRALGHTRIALLSQAGSNIFHAREAAFGRAMRGAGLQVLVGSIARAGLDSTGGVDAESCLVEEEALALLRREERPTAIVAVTDHMALLAMRAAHRLGLSVPGQLSLVGYGDLEMARYACPALSTIRLPFSEIGRLSVRGLLERAGPGQWRDEPLDLQLPAFLVERASTSRPST